MKRLYLSRTEKKIAGVCGGIAEYMELDPTIVRLIVVILALATAIFPILIGYVLGWMIIPHKPIQSSVQA